MGSPWRIPCCNNEAHADCIQDTVTINKRKVPSGLATHNPRLMWLLNHLLTSPIRIYLNFVCQVRRCIIARTRHYTCPVVFPSSRKFLEISIHRISSARGSARLSPEILADFVSRPDFSSNFLPNFLSNFGADFS